MKKNHAGDYRVPPGKKIDLGKWPTKVKALCGSKEEYTSLLSTHIQKLSERQSLLYASNKYALLVIFQALDAAGKDSAIEHVMSGVNPQGCQVFSFKHPGAEELAHDFLWNAARRLPERGKIGIFNRSYYEEVLIVRVHPEILRAEGLPHELQDKKTIWRDRYRSIVNFEDHLHRNGTRIVKFFLHLSREEDGPRQVAHYSEAGLRLERRVQVASYRPYRKVERAAEPALRVEQICAAGDLPGARRGRKRQRH